MASQKTFVPRTAGLVLTGFKATLYDPGNFFFGVPLVTQRHVSYIHLKPGERLLDIGCGTCETIKHLCRNCSISNQFYGVDPSIDILGVARRKLRKLGNTSIEWAVGEYLPFADNQFDWVISSLTWHHFPTHLKKEVAQEAYRVLRKNGKLLISDFGPPINSIGNFFSALWKNHAFTADNMNNVIPAIIAESGFKIDCIKVGGGIIQFVFATKP
jgi:ubiquinone/menaquinone biosynthesis C-methylase UbiE